MQSTSVACYCHKVRHRIGPLCSNSADTPNLATDVNLTDPIHVLRKAGDPAAGYIMDGTAQRVEGPVTV